VKKIALIYYSTRFSAKLFANVLVMRFSNGMCLLGSCGYRAVVRHSDVAGVKNDIIAGGRK